MCRPGLDGVIDADKPLSAEHITPTDRLLARASVRPYIRHAGFPLRARQAMSKSRSDPVQDRTGAGGDTSDRSPSPMVQLRRELVSMSYAEQVEAIRPGRPLQPMPALTTATPGLAVQLFEDVTATDVGDRSTANLLDMTLGEFADYAEGQADWHLTPGLDDAQMTDLRTLLAFVLGQSCNRSACGDMLIADLRALGVDEATLALLAAYSSAQAGEYPTAGVPKTEYPDEAKEWAEYLAALEGALSGTLLSTIMPDWTFRHLADGDWVQDFIDYTLMCEPTYHARDGSEVVSFMDFLDFDQANPADYHGLLPTVRNYHRFTKRALGKLVTNFADTSKSKPLTLVLHSAFCHNGAFHRSEAITNVITNPENHTLMIEGAESLADITDQIGPLAETYGQGGYIDQVLIAGHGSFQRMQLAGTVVEQEGALQVEDDRLDVSAPGEDADEEELRNRADSEALLMELLDNMGYSDLDAPNRRIVLNACLGDVVDVREFDLQADPEAIREEMRANLEARPSLRDYIELMAGASGRPDLEVLGASGLTYSSDMELIDAVTGELVHRSRGRDPWFTSPKLEYIEHGTDLKGVLLTAVECFADPGPDALQTAMLYRLDRFEEPSWDIGLIRAVYATFAEDHHEDGSVLSLLTYTAEFLDKVKGGESFGAQQVETASHFLPSVSANTFWSAVAALDDFEGDVRLFGLHCWMFVEPSVASAFLDELSNRNCSVANQIFMPAVENLLPDLLPLPPGTPSNGQLVLALVAALASNTHAQQYLDGLIGSGDRFPPDLNIEDVLAGQATEAEVLTLLGRTPPPEPAPAPRNANIDLDGDNTNDFWVDPMVATATVTAESTGARHRPSRHEDSYARLREGTSVNIIGRHGHWYAIEYPDAPGGTAFVRRGAVDISG